MLAPTIDHPIMADFVAQLGTINELAEASDGFLWRLKSDGGNATDIQAFDDKRIIVNMSVWASLVQLQDFVFRSMHTTVMRDRKKWFEKPDAMMTVLWYVPEGHQPTVDEAKDRLEYLNAHGPGPTAFTFRDVWPEPTKQTLSDVPSKQTATNMSPFQDLVDYLVANIPAEKILQFRLSDELHNHVYALVDKEKAGTATHDERKELNQYMVVEHIVRLMKTKASNNNSQEKAQHV